MKDLMPKKCKDCIHHDVCNSQKMLYTKDEYNSIMDNDYECDFYSQDKSFKEIPLKEYQIQFSVSGFYEVTVEAKDEEEAKKLAVQECSEADFGALENINYDIWNIS